MQDAWRAYLEMALGLTEAPRKRAQRVAGELLQKGGATAGQLQGLVDDLMSTGMANREALTNLVRYEVDRALGLVGLATAEEVADLTTRVKDLEAELKAARARADAAESGDAATVVPPAKRAEARKAVVKKAAAPNAMPVAATTTSPVKKAAAKKAPPAKKAAPLKKAAPIKEAAAPRKAAPFEEAAPGAVGVTPAETVPARTTDAKAAPVTKAAKKAVAKKAVAKRAAPVKRAAPGTITPAISSDTADVATPEDTQ